MLNLTEPTEHYRGSSNCTINRIHSPFFINPHAEKKEKRKNHQQQIVEVLTKWKEKKFNLNIDFHFFNFDFLKINVIEQILFKQSNDKFKTLNEMALDHLNCKEYENSFQLYNKIKSFQHNF